MFVHSQHFESLANCRHLAGKHSSLNNLVVVYRHSLLPDSSHQTQVMVTVYSVQPQFCPILCVQSLSQLLLAENATYEAGSLCQQRFVTTELEAPKHIRHPSAHCVLQCTRLHASLPRPALIPSTSLQWLGPQASECPTGMV